MLPWSIVGDPVVPHSLVRGLARGFLHLVVVHSLLAVRGLYRTLQRRV